MSANKSPLSVVTDDNATLLATRDALRFLQEEALRSENVDLFTSIGESVTFCDDVLDGHAAQENPGQWQIIQFFKTFLSLKPERRRNLAEALSKLETQIEMLSENYSGGKESTNESS